MKKSEKIKILANALLEIREDSTDEYMSEIAGLTLEEINWYDIHPEDKLFVSAREEMDLASLTLRIEKLEKLVDPFNL